MSGSREIARSQSKVAKSPHRVARGKNRSTKLWRRSRSSRGLELRLLPLGSIPDRQAERSLEIRASVVMSDRFRAVAIIAIASHCGDDLKHRLALPSRGGAVRGRTTATGARGYF